MDEWIPGQRPIKLRVIGQVRDTEPESMTEGLQHRLDEALCPGDETEMPERVTGVPVGLDELSPGERALVTQYRTLDTVPRLAIRCFFKTGDLRLVRAIYDHIFLGLRRR